MATGLQQKLAEFRWFGIVYELADGDLTKFDELYKLNYILCLNMLTYKKLLKDIEIQNIKKQQSKIK